jgi:hypothetical protein
VVTTLGPEQKPAACFEGSWKQASGTGRYQGMVGTGTYQGSMLSPTESLTERWVAFERRWPRKLTVGFPGSSSAPVVGASMGRKLV